MEPKLVKLQFSCDLIDVPKFSGVTLADATSNLEKVSSAVSDAMRNLSEVSSEQISEIKDIVMSLDSVRLNLIKADNRIGDVVSVLSALVKFSEDPQSVQTSEQKTEETNANIVAG